MSVPPSKLVKELTTAYERERNSVVALAMRSYMRDQFEFLGIKSPQRHAIQRAVFGTLGASTDPLTVAELLWEKEDREYQYTACDLLVGVAKSKRLRLAFEPFVKSLSRIRKLIVTRSWWDTVDALSPRVAFHIVGSMGGTAMHDTAWAWGSSKNIWLQRASIILQLGAKKNTDFTLLSELILQHAASKEFFIRKGAGWALREYSKYEPKVVRAFIAKHEKKLSGLTIREGMKYC